MIPENYKINLIQPCRNFPDVLPPQSIHGILRAIEFLFTGFGATIAIDLVGQPKQLMRLACCDFLMTVGVLIAG